MADMICKDCGSAAQPTRVTKGSTFIELILWLCFLVPGLIYSFWRLSSRYDACSSCGSTALVPVDSPVGRGLMQQYHPPVAAPAAGAARPSSAHATGALLGRAFRRHVLRK